jgi:hypothetical protein
MNVKTVKAASAQPQTAQPQTAVRFFVKGLRLVNEVTGEFELMVDQPVNIDHGATIESLKEQGVPHHVIDRAVDKMAEFIWIQTMAEVLAARMSGTIHYD